MPTWVPLCFKMSEQRENVRVKDRLQVSYRLIVSGDDTDIESAEQFFPYIWSKYPSSIIIEEVEDANFKILPHIIDLNRKIDILIELLNQKNRPQVEIPMTRDVNISASGIKINIGEPSTLGQKIALCIILPFVPPNKLFIMGEITRSILLEPMSDEDSVLYDTGLKFLNLREEDQEKIIRYIFKRQRDLLRDKKMLTKDESID